MKPIFGIDVTNDKNSELTYSDRFKTKSLTKATLENLEEKRDNLNTTVDTFREYNSLGRACRADRQNNDFYPRKLNLRT